MAHDIHQWLERLHRLNEKDDIRQSVEVPASSGEVIATLDPDMTMPLSPMLRARFAYAGAWAGAALGQTWLGLGQIAEAPAGVRECSWHIEHLARMTSELSEPVGPSRITLYGLDATKGGATYLVWRAEAEEPAVLAFYGGGLDRFLDLGSYLAFLVGERVHDDSAELVPGTLGMIRSRVAI